MKRATITISDQLEPALEAYLKDQEVAPSLTRLLQTALGEFLSARGYGGSKKVTRTGAPLRTAARPTSTPQPEPRTPAEPRPTPQPRGGEIEVARPVPPDEPVPPDVPEPPDEDETDAALL